MNATLKDRLLLSVATCLGLGYAPIFPGTFGALPGAALYLAVGLLLPHEPAQTLVLLGALTAACAITVYLGSWAERRFERKDASCFVTDEVAGYLLTVLLFRTSLWGAPNVWLTLAWTFPVTRIIDIVKIPPAKRLEKLPSGWGVLADDLLGSLYAAGLLHALCFVWPAAFGIAQ